MSNLCLSIFLFTFFIAIPFFVFVKLRKTELKLQTQNDLFELKRFLSETLAETTHLNQENDPTYFARKGSGSEDEEKDGSGGNQRVKKKKKRAKKKNSSHLQQEDGGGEDMSEKGNSGPVSGSRIKADVVCFYPFTSSTSATQRKIKKQYDELMKCNASKKLTLSQVFKFHSQSFVLSNCYK